eukprot:GDKI01039811.1.p1 GENE.GDKI01039811.1~~GDKI01039811.1.p1  ORF type:complete len:196 (+),score=61.97 GDKI01039811.1:108-695(+)
MSLQTMLLCALSDTGDVICIELKGGCKITGIVDYVDSFTTDISLLDVTVEHPDGRKETHGSMVVGQAKVRYVMPPEHVDPMEIIRNFVEDREASTYKGLATMGLKGTPWRRGHTQTHNIATYAYTPSNVTQATQAAATHTQAAATHTQQAHIPAQQTYIPAAHTQQIYTPAAHTQPPHTQATQIPGWTASQPPPP